MNEPSLILCERRGKWAVAVARHLKTSIRVTQTRSLAECGGALAAAPSSLVALEMTRENLADPMAWLAEMAARFPAAKMVVLADRDLASFEWQARELGAGHYLVSTRQSEELALLAARHLADRRARRTNLAGQIWEQLPWSHVA